MDQALARNIRNQAIFWLVALAVFIGLLWLFRGILLPFVAGMALAYFLDPVADGLERIGLGRLAATVVILVFFIIIFVLALMILAPLLSNQLLTFMDLLPEYAAELQALIASIDNKWLKDFIRIEEQSLNENLDQLLSQGASWISTVLGGLWNSSVALFNIASLLVVTPVVAFYLLYDWDRMIAKMDGWLPRDHRDEIHEIVGDINIAIAGFVRGQGTLCLILGTFYAVALSIVPLNFGFLIGMFAGLISFIPYVGSLTGLVLSMGVALVQFWPSGDYVSIALVAFIFVFGQFMEGNFLQPKLVGSSVGLHPVWLMFALFAFGSYLGFTGMLIAVPAAAAVGVLVRYALKRYLASPLYSGEDAD